MRKKWLRQHFGEGTFVAALYHEASRARLLRLCNRLGIEFTDNPDEQVEMWAQIGDYLALEQEEFNRATGRGRPKKIEDKEVEIAEFVEECQNEAADRGGKLSDEEALELSMEKLPPRVSMDTRRSQLSRGRVKIEALRYHGAGDDDISVYDHLRAERDDDCAKIG